MTNTDKASDWTVQDDGDQNQPVNIIDSRGVLRACYLSRKDAALILGTVNAHDKLVEALRGLAELDYPRAVAETYRDDGKNSKHDKCPHGLYMYEECGNCISDFASQTLKELNL